MNDEPGIEGVSDPIEVGRGGFGVVYRSYEDDLDLHPLRLARGAPQDISAMTHAIERLRSA